MVGCIQAIQAVLIEILILLVLHLSRFLFEHVLVWSQMSGDDTTTSSSEVGQSFLPRHLSTLISKLLTIYYKY
jgi:hypothetical protein